MKISKTLSIIGILFLSFACKKKEDVKEIYEFDINQIAIQDSAKLLMILTEESNTLSTNGAGTQLYMITKSDKVVQRTLSKTTGEDVSSVMKPGFIANATPNYILAGFSRFDAIADEAYLIDKKTGKLNQIGNRSHIPAFSSFATLKNNLICKYDGQKYLYYKTSSGISDCEFIKLDVKTLTLENILPDSVNVVTSFDVDAQGNILADMDYINGKRKFVAFKNKIINYLPNNNFKRGYWVANDGIFRNVTLDGNIEKIEFDETLQKFNNTKEIRLLDFSIVNNFNRDECYRVSYSDKTIMVSANEIFELYPVEKKIKQITTVPIVSVKWVDHSNVLGHLYVAGESASGQETIFNIDLSNYSYKTYPVSGKYSFYEIEAFEDGTIYATAKRKSDGKNVVLKFAPDGTETVLYDQLGTKKGVWLEKVTEYTND